MTTKHTYTFPGTETVHKAKELLHEGNVTRIRLKRKDKTLVDVSLTVGASLAAAGLLAVLGAFAAAAKDSTVEIERDDSPKAEEEVIPSAEHVKVGQHIERVVKAEMRHWLGAHEEDDWEQIGLKLVTRVRAKLQEEKESKKNESPA